MGPVGGTGGTRVRGVWVAAADPALAGSRASSLNSKKVMMSSSRRSSRDDVLADIDQAKGYPEIAVEQIRQLALIILDDMKAVDEP